MKVAEGEGVRLVSTPLLGTSKDRGRRKAGCEDIEPARDAERELADATGEDVRTRCRELDPPPSLSSKASSSSTARSNSSILCGESCASRVVEDVA